MQNDIFCAMLTQAHTKTKQNKPATKHIGPLERVWEATKAQCGNQGSPQPGSPRSQRAAFTAWHSPWHFEANTDKAGSQRKWWEKLPQWNRRVKHDLRWKWQRGYGTQGTLRVRSVDLFLASASAGLRFEGSVTSLVLASSCVLVISAWWYLRIEFFRWRAGSSGCMMKLQYGFLRLGYFVTGRYCTTIQYAANLTELAYGRLKVIDPLGWDVLYAFKLLACFSRSLVASSTSLVVTWQRVSWVLGGDTWRIWISMSFWNQFLGASECIAFGFFKHILCPSGAIHHWSVMACDCKCGQVLQAELAELKQRRQELREVASCLGWMGVWCFQSATFPCLACVRPSKLTKHTWRPRRSERPSWSRRSLVLFLPVEGTMYLLSEI